MGEREEADAIRRRELGVFLKDKRRERELTLRDVEEVTNKEVSNAYLSQLETGKISRPAPHILYALSTALVVPYEELMRRAGYLKRAVDRDDEEKHGQVATRAIENLTKEEEEELRRHLNYIRWARARNEI